MTELTAKQSAFCEEYLKDLNASAAAVRAGYSRKSAGDIAAQLLGKTQIAERIAELKAERSRKTKIDAAWVLKRLAAEAEADLADLYDDDGRLKPIKDWPPIWRQGLVAGVEVEELFEGRGDDREQIGVVKKVRLSDRVKRIELIGKHIDVSAFQENVNLTGVDGLAERLARASKRLAELEADDGNDGEEAEGEGGE